MPKKTWQERGSRAFSARGHKSAARKSSRLPLWQQSGRRKATRSVFPDSLPQSLIQYVSTSRNTHSKHGRRHDVPNCCRCCCLLMVAVDSSRSLSPTAPSGLCDTTRRKMAAAVLVRRNGRRERSRRRLVPKVQPRLTDYPTTRQMSGEHGRVLGDKCAQSKGSVASVLLSSVVLLRDTKQQSSSRAGRTRTAEIHSAATAAQMRKSCKLEKDSSGSKPVTTKLRT